MTYLHHIPGRIRIRAAGVKRSSVGAAALRKWLLSLDGVEQVEVSTVTGTALIHYKPAAIDGRGLIENMRRQGWIESASVPHQDAPSLESLAAKLVLRSVAELVIERSLLAVAAAVL